MALRTERLRVVWGAWVRVVDAAVGVRGVPVALAVLVLVLDAVMVRVPFDVLLTGMMDEPAHLATALLVLLAAAPSWCREHPGLLLVTLLSAVLIDLDHVPLFLGVDWVSTHSMGRPFSHALLTLVVLALAALAWPRGRRVLLAVLTGVALHFSRDLFTGPGLTLLWPLTDAYVRLPYPLYAVAVVVLAAVAVVRAPRSARAGGPASVR